ncbi:MAG: DUF72 domain-containing protein [Acidimicrobiales bacterium]
MKLRDAAGWLANHVDARGGAGGRPARRWCSSTPLAAGCRSPAGVPGRGAVLAAGPVGGGAARSQLGARRRVCRPARRGAALVLHDLLDPTVAANDASWTYLRLHGPAAAQQPYRGRYGRRRLAVIAERLIPWLAEGGDVYAYCNNDIGADAPEDAALLRELLSTGSIQPNG